MTGPRTALITGITGQDGSYLAERLLARGDRVVGLIRRPEAAVRAEPNLAGFAERVELIGGELSDQAGLTEVLRRVRPQQVYHLAAASRVSASWSDPVGTAEANGLGTLRLLEAVRAADPTIRLVHASSCEIFGRPDRGPQNEDSPIRPRSPYGAAKAFATHCVTLYREVHGMWCSNAILYNHESPRRGAEFVTRKIAVAVARIAAGQQQTLELGNLAARRDWSFAGDTVRALEAMLAQERPMDFVIGTGVQHTVQDFAAAAFAAVGLDWRSHVRVDARLFRPDDAEHLFADATRAARVLDWRPTVSFAELVSVMVHAEQARLGQGPTSGRVSCSW